MKKSDKLYFYYQPWTRDEIIGDIRRLRDWIDYLPCEEAGTPGLIECSTVHPCRLCYIRDRALNGMSRGDD